MVSRPDVERPLQAPRETRLTAPVDDAAMLREDLLDAYEELRTQNEELAAVRLELESAAARNEQLFGGSPVAYVITDPKGIVLEANRAARQLVGRSAASQSRRSITTQFPLEARRTIRTLISRASVVGQPQLAQVTIRRGDGDLELRVTVQLRIETHSGAALLRWSWYLPTRCRRCVW